MPFSITAVKQKWLNAAPSDVSQFKWWVRDEWEVEESTRIKRWKWLWPAREHKSIHQIVRVNTKMSKRKAENIHRKRGWMKKKKRWCHWVVVPNMFLSRGSLISRIRFQDRFAAGRLELISSYRIPRDRIEEQMEPDHQLSSLLNNWEDYCILSLRNKVA